MCVTLGEEGWPMQGVVSSLQAPEISKLCWLSSASTGVGVEVGQRGGSGRHFGMMGVGDGKHVGL